jgi:hypothetical protein
VAADAGALAACGITELIRPDLSGFQVGRYSSNNTVV